MATSNSFINAKITRSFIISESTKCVTPLSTAPTKGALRESGTLQVAWAHVDGDDILTITPEMRCAILVNDVEHLQYECKSETRFTVASYGGFDPEKELPIDATAPYGDMALWLVRLHAANAIREAGIPSFSFSKPIGAQQIAMGQDGGGVEGEVPGPSKAAVKVRSRPAGKHLVKKD